MHLDMKIFVLKCMHICIHNWLIYRCSKIPLKYFAFEKYLDLTLVVIIHCRFTWPDDRNWCNIDAIFQNSCSVTRLRVAQPIKPPSKLMQLSFVERKGDLFARIFLETGWNRQWQLPLPCSPFLYSTTEPSSDLKIINAQSNPSANI